MTRFLPILFAVLVAAWTGPGEARVDAIEITDRRPFAGGAKFGETGSYELLRGRITYSVDPAAAANRDIVDLALAPMSAAGRVVFRGDFVLLKPQEAELGNRRLLFEVTNRGNLALLSFFNLAPFNNRPESARDAGDGFLLKRGYSLLWTAWNWDVSEGWGRLQVDLPVAFENGHPVRGRVVAEMVAGRPTKSMPLAWGNSRGYPAVAAELGSARLTVRGSQRQEGRLIGRSAWRLQDNRLTLARGFEPGQIYEFDYLATGARVVGLGLASLRDAGSFFSDRGRRENPLAGAIDHVIAFGHSQSGRVLQHMLWQGFHLDEAGRPVFDAMFINAPGGGKGSFNHRFAQTTRHPSQHEDHQYPADFFPFATVPQADPVTRRRADLLARARGTLPRLFYTQTSSDYWSRSASLIHAEVTGDKDLPIDPSARIYFFAGAQHFIRVPAERGRFALCHNPADYRYLMRPLLLHLDRWIDGREPPDSRLPSKRAGTLGDLVRYRRLLPVMPAAGGQLRAPHTHLRPPRLDLGAGFQGTGIITRQPPELGPPFETLLPLPDRDGIDRGGLRLPQIAVPLGSYLGWNHRRDGADKAIGRWSGSYVPFARTRDAIAGATDARPPIDERYLDRADYVAGVAGAAADLVRQGHLLQEDVSAIVASAGRRYDAQLGRDPADPGCGYLRQ
jgi:hypothetical protein